MAPMGITGYLFRVLNTPINDFITLDVGITGVLSWKCGQKEEKYSWMVISIKYFKKNRFLYKNQCVYWDRRLWSSRTANSDKKYMELNKRKNLY